MLLDINAVRVIRFVTSVFVTSLLHSNVTILSRNSLHSFESSNWAYRSGVVVKRVSWAIE